MNDLPQALPSCRTERHAASRSVRWTAAFVAALGFGFMGSTLIDASEPGSRFVSASRAMVAPTDMDIYAPSTGHAEDFNVERAVRQWAWESPGVDAKPSRRQDLEEIWLVN